MMQTDLSVQKPTGAPPVHPTPGRSRYVLGVLFIVGVFNMMDRQILGILIEPIQADLGVSDTEMGFLTGFAFALFYTVATLPLARLADRHARSTILAAGLAVWSAFTAVSGAVTSFFQLAAARVGVGIGEASFNTTGLSMLSDHYPAERRVEALSIFSVSMKIGVMASLVLGGMLGEMLGWRLTLVWMGLPGLLLALVVRFTVR